jgi:hypothetical protein
MALQHMLSKEYKELSDFVDGYYAIFTSIIGSNLTIVVASDEGGTQNLNGVAVHPLVLLPYDNSYEPWWLDEKLELFRKILSFSDPGKIGEHLIIVRKADENWHVLSSVYNIDERFDWISYATGVVSFFSLGD